MGFPLSTVTYLAENLSGLKIFHSLSLGNRVLAFYSLSLEEIPLSFASGERMRILFFIGQGSKRSKVVFQWGLLSWEPNLDI